MLTVSKALLMSSAAVSVRSGGLFWLKPVVIMLCSYVLVEWLLLKPCCVEMYGSSVFSVFPPYVSFVRLYEGCDFRV